MSHVAAAILGALLVAHEADKPKKDPDAYLDEPSEQFVTARGDIVGGVGLDVRSGDSARSFLGGVVQSTLSLNIDWYRHGTDGPEVQLIGRYAAAADWTVQATARHWLWRVAAGGGAVVDAQAPAHAYAELRFSVAPRTTVSADAFELFVRWAPASPQTVGGGFLARMDYIFVQIAAFGPSLLLQTAVGMRFDWGHFE